MANDLREAEAASGSVTEGADNLLRRAHRNLTPLAVALTGLAACAGGDIGYARWLPANLESLMFSFLAGGVEVFFGPCITWARNDTGTAICTRFWVELGGK